MNKIQKSIVAACSVLSAFTLGQAQAAQLSANASVTTNYVFRGVTQTDDGPAIQGGLDYNHENGLYAGAWASNMEEGLEIDVYAGFTKSINPDVNIDLGLLFYNYTDDVYADTNEIKISGSFKMVNLAYYIGDADGADYTYLDLSAQHELPEFVISGHIGLFDPDGGDSGNDFAIGVSKFLTQYGIDVGVTLTQASKEVTGTGDSETEVFVTATKNYDL